MKKVSTKAQNLNYNVQSKDFGLKPFSFKKGSKLKSFSLKTDTK